MRILPSLLHLFFMHFLTQFSFDTLFSVWNVDMNGDRRSGVYFFWLSLFPHVTDCKLASLSHLRLQSIRRNMEDICKVNARFHTQAQKWQGRFYSQRKRTRIAYFNKLENCVFPHLSKSAGIMFHHDGASPQFGNVAWRSLECLI
jgi:hypothetical protein